MSQGCDWWSSSEFLPTTAGPRAPRPIAGIINTSDDPDHIGGNAMIAAAGRTYGVRNIDGTLPGAWVVAHENVTLRGAEARPAEPLLASETYGGAEKKLNFFNGEAVVVTHMPAAHTDADSVVYFRGSDVLAVGDVLDMTSYPVIDVARGGTIQGQVERAQLDAGRGRGRAHDGGRHADRARTRPHDRLGGRRLLPRHGHDHARPRARR